MSTLLVYLLESSAYLLVFTLLYRGLLSRHTHFQWMRFYLILTVGASLILPLLPSPAGWISGWLNPAGLPDSLSGTAFPLQWQWTNLSSDGSAVRPENNPLWSVPAALPVIYFLGVLYHLGWFGWKLMKVRQLMISLPKRKEGRYWVVALPPASPSFSFLNHIFLGHEGGLSAAERQQIKLHELAHGRQGHSYDLLFFELAHVILWFHPLMPYLRTQLQEVQEYLADQAVVVQCAKKKDYASLLLKLATEKRPVPLAAGFSSKQVSRRIRKLSQPRSRRKWQFGLILPVAAGLFLLSGCWDESSTSDSSPDNLITPEVVEVPLSRVRSIEWRGNTVYDDATLTEVLGVQPGDPYDSARLYRRLSYVEGQPDVSSLYMDHGYLYLNIEVQTEKAGDQVDLIMNIYEGEPARVSEIRIRGNQNVSREEILSRIPFEPGELFSRSKLIDAQRAIAGMGYFDPENVGINPLPDPENKEVAIEFVLQPKLTP